MSEVAVVERKILNIGAGNKIIAGAINHDLHKHRAEIDVAHDLNILPWPWPDQSFDLIVACAVLEHLQITLIESVNECWRILKPNGVLHMKLPYWNHANSYRDPTHYWRFDLGTCDLFDPDTKYGHDYAFYPVRKWTIIRRAELNNAGSSFSIKLQVRK